MLIFKPQDLRSRSQLAAIDVPVRDDVSDRWKGVRHKDLADALVSTAESRGLAVKDERWGVSKDDADLFGVVEFGREVEGVPGGFSMALGLRHSNLSRYAVTFAVGGTVTVCSNGMISGSFVLKKKHTTGFSLQDAIGSGIDRYLVEAQAIREQIDSLRDIDLSGRAGEQRVAEALVAAGRHDVLPWSLLGKVDREWRAPRHEEFKPRNGWSLYNCATEIVKEAGLGRQLKTIDGMRRMILAGDGAALLDARAPRTINAEAVSVN